MEKQSENLRDRLLARLPQPENIATYREETAALLAKHEKALFWEKWGYYVLTFCVFVVFMVPDPMFGLKFDEIHHILIYVAACTLLLFVGLDGLRIFIYRSQVNMLKEVKQLQLQVLELQASLHPDSR